MSTPNTPSADLESGHINTTPLLSPPSNALESSISSSPGPQPLQPIEPAEPVSDEAVTVQSATTLVPQGRPLKFKSDPTPPPLTSWQHDSQQQDVWDEPASAASVVHQPPALSQVQLQYGRPPPEAAYIRGGHLLGGYNPARYSGNSTAHPRFNAGGRVFLLTNASSLEPWVQQISYIARSLSCFDELTKRFTSFPQPCTVQLFICETRFASAFRVLEGLISGPVWAYMRVLGYSSIPDNGEGLMSPTPADCFEYAKLAASKMAVAGTPEQPAEERTRMVREVLTAQATEYPGERAYKKGIQWLRLACDSLIRQGDYELARSLYDPLPDWAPKPPGYGESAASATTNGQEPTSDPNGNHDVANSPALDGPASISAVPDPPKLVPESHKLNKRKRMKPHIGPKPNKQGEPSVGGNTVA